MTTEELAKSLRNIGPVVAKQLIACGIDTPKKLKNLGAEEAFLEVMAHGGFGCGKAHAAYLYALEGAIRNCDWRKIPEKTKQRFKQLAKELRRSAITIL